MVLHTTYVLRVPYSSGVVLVFLVLAGNYFLLLRMYLVYNTVVCLCRFFCSGGKANLVQIFLLNPRIFFSYIGIGIRRGWTTDRKLYVDTLIFIPM